MADQTTLIRTLNDREVPVPGHYAIDPAHTSVEFVGRHLMITKVRGRFPDVSGIITVDDEPARSHVEVTIGVSSIDSGNPDRDAQLRGPDFFDATQFPTITFKSTQVEVGESDTWMITGDLTVRDVTRPVTLEFEFDGANASPFGDQRIGFSAATEVDREAWGLTFNVALETGGVLVGKKVRIELNVQAVASAPA